MRSGDGSLQNVGVQINAPVACPDCRQRFASEAVQRVHWRHVHRTPSWREAMICEQQLLQLQVVEVGGGAWAGPLRVAGVDVTVPKRGPSCGCVVVMELDGEAARVVYEDFEWATIDAPYVSGLLGAREVPVLTTLLERLRRRPDLWPDVLLVDGNGVLHPRRCGLASHLGVLFDVPAVGVGKTLLCLDGLDDKRQTPRHHGGALVWDLAGRSRVWGRAVVPRPASRQPPQKPVFVSVGHKLGLDAAVAVVQRCCLAARVPEPIRHADLKSRRRVRAQQRAEQLADASAQEHRAGRPRRRRGGPGRAAPA